MDKGKVIIISPDGKLYISSINDSGHAVKLIEYYNENNIDYNKEDAIYTPSQEFALNLSNYGYMVFLIEPSLTCLFINQNGMFDESQINTLEENKEIFNKILSGNVISFNLELNSLFNTNNKLYSLINYINKNIKCKER